MLKKNKDLSFEGGIIWNQSNQEIINFVDKNAQNEKKAFTFIFGFKMEILKCEESTKSESSLTEVGTIFDKSNDGFLVKTKTGSIIVKNYLIHTPYIQFNNLEKFLEKARVSTNPILTSSAFTSNDDANLWEMLYQKFVMEESQIDEYDMNSGFQKIILESKINVKSENIQHEGHEKMLINANEKFIKYLIKKIDLKKNDRVLDLGCATGWATAIFANEELESHGGDISPLSIKQARISVPTANFFVLDIFDLIHHDNLKEKFDFVFCRDLGIAQKIVDWEDEKWINVAKGLMNILSEKGVLFWIQMSNLTGDIYETGFSNPKIKTLLGYFRRYGFVLDLDIFSYQCFLVTKKNVNQNLLFHIKKFNQNTHNNIYSWWKTEKSEQSIKEFSKVIYSKVSKLFLLDQKILDEGVIIFGNNKIANAYFKLLQEKGMFKAFCWNENYTGENFGNKILPFKDATKLKSSILILTDSEQVSFIKKMKLESSFKHIIDAFSYNENYSKDEIYLLSGDQDETIGKVLLPPIMEMLN